MGWQDASGLILSVEQAFIYRVYMYPCVTIPFRHIVYEYGDLEFVDDFRKNLLYTKKCDKVSKLMLVGRLIVRCFIGCTGT